MNKPNVTILGRSVDEQTKCHNSRTPLYPCTRIHPSKVFEPSRSPALSRPIRSLSPPARIQIPQSVFATTGQNMSAAKGKENPFIQPPAELTPNAAIE